MRLLTASIVEIVFVATLACGHEDEVQPSSLNSSDTRATAEAQFTPAMQATPPATIASPDPSTSAQPTARTPEEEPLQVGGDVLPPQVVSRVYPDYNALPRPLHVTGVPVVEAVISRSGKVTQVHMVKATNPHLDSAIMNALKQWKFRPATRNGHPVAVRFIMTVNIHWQ